MFKTLCVVGLVAWTASAQAHQIWLEQPAPPAQGTAAVYFGEFSENLRENSEKLLGSFHRLQATHVSAQGEKHADAQQVVGGFLLPFSAGPGETVVVHDGRYPLQTFEREGKKLTSWYWPSARWVGDFTARQPRMVLDLVTTGTSGELALYFDQQPLADTQVSVVTPSGWAKQAKTDARGRVQFDWPWKGQYVAEVTHVLRKPGARDGEKYDGISYVTTLTYVQAQGLEPVAAQAAATPSP